MSKIKKRLWMGTSVVVALAVVVAVAYAAGNYEGSFTTLSANGGIGMGTAATSVDYKTIQFDDCDFGDPGYIDFSQDYDNYIVAMEYGFECLHLHADHLMMKSEYSGASVVVDQYGDVVITLGS